MFLNDVEDGGELRFPKLGLQAHYKISLRIFSSVLLLLLLLLLRLLLLVIIITIIITAIQYIRVSITRFPLRRFSPGAGLLRNVFVHR